MSKVTVTKIEYTEVERLMREAYGLDEFCAVGEAGNGTDYLEEGIKPWAGTSKYDKEEVDHIINSKYATCWQLDTVLSLLCLKGKIEPGDYLVEVWW